MLYIPFYYLLYIYLTIMNIYSLSNNLLSFPFLFFFMNFMFYVLRKLYMSTMLIPLTFPITLPLQSLTGPSEIYKLFIMTIV